MSVQALREQRAAKAKALNDLVNKDKWDAATDQPVYDSGLAELDALDAQIKRISDVNARIAEQALNENVADHAARIGHNSKSVGAAIFSKWLKGGDKALTPEDWAIVNTMSTTTNSEGGYTVASDVSKSIIDALKAFGGMREEATVIAMAQGNPLSFPTSDGTSEEGELIAENTTATDLDVSFGTVALPVYKFSSKVVTVPFELLQDSVVDIEAFVRNRLVTRLGRITNKMFTTGTGSSQPNGLITAAGTGVTAANSTSQVTAVTYASLVDLVHSVDAAYRGEGCCFMMNDQSVRNIRKIVDGQSRPIFAPGYEQGPPGGAPDRLLGYRICVNQSVANMAAGAKSIAFGAFGNYVIRDVMNVEMFRFTDSAYTKKGQVGFLAWMRSGGNLIDTNAVKLFVNAAS